MDFISVMHPLVESNLINNSKYSIMKTQEVVRKPETLEDIIFEGRNKSYGAFDLNQKRGKYLIISFLVSFIGLSTAVAVPFINSFKNKAPVAPPEKSIPVILIGMENPTPEIPLPPPPPEMPEQMQKAIAYRVPEVVEEVQDPENGFDFSAIESVTENAPIDLVIEPIVEVTRVIDEPEEEIFFNPQEKASFMGGNEETFLKWVQMNLVYPAAAADANIEGKVFIEFCVNSKGEVVDIKVVRKLHPDIDNETVRVIDSSPRWAPAKQGGNPVKQRFTIPIVFDLI